MIFNTSLDKLSKVITISATLIFVLIIIGQFTFLQNTDRPASYFTIGILVIIYIVSYAFKPIKYEVTKDFLIIHRPISNVEIKCTEIKNIEILDKDRLKKTIRTFGNGGLFGYYGKFANPTIGKMTWYATRKNNTVLVQTTEDKNIILTPDEPKKFVESLNSINKQNMHKNY